MSKEKLGLSGRLKVGKKKVVDVKKMDKLVENLNDTNKVVKTSIHYPADLYRRVRMKVADEGITIREYVINLIKDDLDL